MSVTWHNVYSDLGVSVGSFSADAANFWRADDGTWLRVEERWNSHRLCTPVGMHSADATTPGERLANDILDAMGMDKFWRDAAHQLRRTEVDPSDGKLPDRIMEGIHWRVTPQGEDYWCRVHNKLEEAGY